MALLPGDLEVQRELARALRKGGNLEGSLDCLEKLLDEDPDYLPGLVNLCSTRIPARKQIPCKTDPGCILGGALSFIRVTRVPTFLFLFFLLSAPLAPRTIWYASPRHRFVLLLPSIPSCTNRQVDYAWLLEKTLAFDDAIAAYEDALTIVNDSASSSSSSVSSIARSTPGRKTKRTVLKPEHPAFFLRTIELTCALNRSNLVS